jgi:hypothetical protein
MQKASTVLQLRQAQSSSAHLLRQRDGIMREFTGMAFRLLEPLIVCDSPLAAGCKVNPYSRAERWKLSHGDRLPVHCKQLNPKRIHISGLRTGSFPMAIHIHQLASISWWFDLI